MTTRKCRNCAATKPLTDFVLKAGKRENRCKVCKNARSRELYKNRVEASSPERKAQIRKNVKVWRHNHKKALDDYKASKPCLDCGRKYPSYVMDFDHRDPSTKEFSVSSAFRVGTSKERVEAEIAKCDLVCANCHRERTHGAKRIIRRCASGYAS